MSIYTKIGDTGKTTFFGYGLVDKNDPRIEFLGTLDELNSIVGVTLCFVEDTKLKEILNKIQNDLFQLGADVVGSKLAPESMPRITTQHIHELENAIDQLEEKLGLPNKFIFPGGTTASAFLHLCRATTRRAERVIVGLKDSLNLRPETLCYINRLSDLLYVLAREANKEMDIKEQQPMYKYFNEEEKI